MGGAFLSHGTRGVGALRKDDVFFARKDNLTPGHIHVPATAIGAQLRVFRHILSCLILWLIGHVHFSNGTEDGWIPAT